MAVRESQTELLKALDSIARYLALRDHSLHELKQKLSRRYEDEIIREALGEAEARGWLGDEQAIAERLAGALARKNKSRRYIEAQLKKRRLPAVTLEATNELEKARELLVRKFGEEKLSFEDKAKAFRFLRNRGFDDRSIRKVLNNEYEE